MDYRFFHSIVKEVYTDIPNPKMPPQAHLRDLRRYAGAFDSLELGLEESYCFLSLRTPGEDPVVYLGKTGRKHNAVSEGNFLQCAGWKQTGDVLLERFDEILGTRFHTEAEVDAFAELGTVPSEEGNPVPRPIAPVKVEREAIRAILYGTMLRWQQGTPQVHIAVPKAEMERYNDYVLGAVKIIWSYFPAFMRAAVGFSSYLSPRRERDFPKFSVIFIPYHMADVNTIRLDGSSPNAYAAMIRSTGIQQLDLVLETLASLDDPEDRKGFLRGLFDDVEREADLKTRGFSPMAYVKWGRGLELLNAKTPVSEQIPEWLKFSRAKENFPAAISRKVDEYIDKHLTPGELNKALEQELRGGRPSLAVLDRVVENYLPLCAARSACKEGLWAFVRDSLGKSGLPADRIYQILQEREESWGRLTDPKSYGELKTESGRQAALSNKSRIESLIREAGNMAMKQERPNSAMFRDRLTKLRMQFREESAAYVDEVSLKEMDAELKVLQRSYVASALDRELQLEAREQPRGHHAIQEEKKKVSDLAALLPEDRSPQEQELYLRMQQRQNELDALLEDASTISADLQQRLRSINNYFEALDVAAAQAEVLSEADRNRLRAILAEKRPNKRAGYLEAFRMHYGQNLSLQALKRKKGFFRDCVEEDLARLFDVPQSLEMRGATTASLLRQIQTLKRESELFGAERGLQIAIGQEPLDGEMTERILGLQPQDVAGQEKQRVGRTSMQLLCARVFSPDQLCELMKLFEAAECKMDLPVKAVLNGEGGELSRQELLCFLRTVLEIQQRRGMDREKALGWISEKMDAAASNPEAEAAFKALVAENQRKGKGKGLWIALTAVLGLLLIAAVLWIFLRPAPAPEEPLPSETESLPDAEIQAAFQDPAARGRLDLSGRGIEDGKLQELVNCYLSSGALVDGQIPPQILEDPELLNELGYPTALDLSNNPAITGLGEIPTLTGLRRLYLDNCSGIAAVSEEVKPLSNLELLSLRGVPLTEEQIRELSEALPDCLILWTRDGQETLSLGGAACGRGQQSLYLSGHGAALIRVLDEENLDADLADVLELHLDGAPIPSLEGLEKLGALRYLDLSDTGLTDELLPALYPMSNLSVLDLSGCDLSETAVKNLREALPNCEILAFPAADRTEAPLITICGMEVPADARSLDLSGKSITEADIAVLHDFTSLQKLDISRTRVGNLSFLEGMDSLRILILSDNEVEDLSPLWKLPGLEQVYAQNNPVKTLGLSKNMPAPALRVLSLSGPLPELDAENLVFAENLVILSLGEFRENPEKPLAEVFGTLTRLRYLRLHSMDQLSPESLAAMPASCVRSVVISPEPNAPADPAPTDAPAEETGEAAEETENAEDAGTLTSEEGNEPENPETPEP